MSWSWEYDPDDLADGAPEAFIAQVEEVADELTRAASALYGDGTAFTGPNPRGATRTVDGGMFVYLVIPRSECVYIRQLTPKP
ncbi:hypothetical protein LO772_29490 [Yinghuangia sp. ASG 101]|uniref:hypothetical protein n=1 Tax=Yinghuangia sp. ASG 101 TaxID=2896848 RepID=UPI001E317064|nr:hypothetical protein [Yinghuangia sp. ASG 101]UGQ10905.1 hypothetical protein LO772_29490 [Yinghuangia sp. ASG 101]